MDYTLKGSFNYAKNLILNIKCGENISFVTIHEISSRILENFDENAEVLLGCRAEDGFSPDEVQIVLVTASLIVITKNLFLKQTPKQTQRSSFFNF